MDQYQQNGGGGDTHESPDELDHSSEPLYPNYTTVSRRSGCSKCETNEVCIISERMVDRYAIIQRNVASTLRNDALSFVHCSSKKSSFSLSHNMAWLRNLGKKDTFHHHSCNVIFEPSVNESQNLRKSKNLRVYKFGKDNTQIDPESFVTVRNWRNLLSNVEYSDHGTKCSREISGETTQQTGYPTKNGSKKVRNFALNENKNERSLELFSGYARTSDWYHEWKDSSSSSIVRPIKSSVGTASYQPEAGYTSRGPRTTAKMFALYNTEKPKKISYLCDRFPLYTLAQGRGSGTWDYQSGNGNKDLSRALSASVSSRIVYGKNLNPRRTIIDRHGLSMSGDMVIKKSLQEKFNCDTGMLQSCRENFSHRVLVRSLQEEKFRPFNSSFNDVSSYIGQQVGNFSVQRVEDCFPANAGLAADSTSPASSIESEQLSPVSVLREDISNSFYYKQVTADPHAFQMQPDLHEIESCSEEPEISILSDGNIGIENKTLKLVEDIPEEFADEEERDFSYLLDVLIDSGIHGADQDRLYRASHLTDCPVRPSVFNNLEKKYNKLTGWSKPGRKLLFDLINCILSDLLEPSLDLHPWVKPRGRIAPMWGSEGLVEKVWQVLVRLREELPVGKPEKKVLDAKWWDLRDAIDMIGREIERRIRDELMEEVVLELQNQNCLLLLWEVGF